MLKAKDIEKALRLQARCFELSRWLRHNPDARKVPRPEPKAMKRLELMQAWLEEVRPRLPAELRPAPDEITAFANMLSSFEMTLGLDRRVRPADKRTARATKANMLTVLANDAELPLLYRDLQPLAGRRDRFGWSLACVTYTRELIRRCDYARYRHFYGDMQRAVLVLWRQTACDRHGRVPKGFRLSTSQVLNAQRFVIAKLREHARRLERGESPEKA